MADRFTQIADLRLSLPDMTRKPLLGPAPRMEILEGAELRHPEGRGAGDRRRLGFGQIDAGPRAGAAVGADGRDASASTAPTSPI